MCLRPPPPAMGSPRWFTAADLRGHAAREDPQPLILVADDHASVASAVSRSLLDVGPVLAPVTSLRLIQRVVPMVAPLVLVSDLDFEGVFALDALQELNQSHPAIRVIAYSGHANDVVRRLVGGAGLFGLVAKLDPLEELRALIDSARGQMSREPIHRSHPQSTVYARRGRRKPHDLGALIRWALDSGFKPAAIGRVIQVSPQTVAYHAKGQSLTRKP